MNRLDAILLVTGLLGGQAAFAQPAQPTNPSSFQNRVNTIVKRAAGESTDSVPNLTRFDLDFPGGTANDLIQAVEKASDKPLNVVIPIGSADTPLPPLKMRAVTVPQLFKALEAGSQFTRKVTSSGGTVTPLSYGFQTLDQSPRDDSVWFFHSQMWHEQKPEKTCRFWQLAPFLEDYTVDDITTAIETGYKMLGEPAPVINFHKDTRLLIAVGEGNKLNLIDEVLRQLQPALAAEAKKASTGPARKPEASPTPAASGTRAP
jgi:hypothetical protein